MYMVAAGLGCRKVIGGSGWTTSHLGLTNGLRNCHSYLVSFLAGKVVSLFSLVAENASSLMSGCGEGHESVHCHSCCKYSWFQFWGQSSVFSFDFSLT